MKSQMDKNGFTRRFKWVSFIYALFMIGLIGYIVAADFVNYAPIPEVVKAHDLLFFPLWVLMFGYRIGVRRTTRKLTAPWKD